MELLNKYIPLDRRQAMAKDEELPDRTEGAVLLADISGFTPLTEALERELGTKRGAEELTRELNLVYEALIAEVHHYGGSVINFSGDAITCWFDGNLAPTSLQATACGLAMQATMHQFTDIKTSSGKTIRFGMKAAVATGPVRRFRVGDPKIQQFDVLAGAVLDRMTAAEKLAKKGDVVIGPETIAHIKNSVVVAEYRTAKQKNQVGLRQNFAVITKLKPSAQPTSLTKAKPSSSSAPGGQSLTESQTRPWILPPVYQRLKSGQNRFLAEIRPVVALFLKFGRLDYDSDDAAGEKLDAYIRLVQNILAYYEGYLIQLTIGDKGNYLFAAFGAPLAHDDDPVRAVAAALELRLPPPELDFTGEVQIGISQGKMRVGAYGSSTRRTYGVLGTEVNIASRLMELAQQGQIIVSQHIADAVAHHYQLEPIGLINLRGVQDPLPISRVSGRRQPSLLKVINRFIDPLIGRDSELAQMQEILEAVATGDGQILRLEGVAGIGKSHLAAEFLERAVERGLRIALGVCQSTNKDIAYTPWRQIFRALFVLSSELEPGETQADMIARQINQLEIIMDQLNPDWRLRLPLLGDLLGIPIPDNTTTAAFDPQLRQEALFALTVDLLQTWAATQPLVILLEDIHWMDEASLRLTLAVARIISNTPILLILVHRPHETPLLPDLDQLPEYNHLHLPELSRQGVKALVRHQLQGKPSSLVLALIQTQAQGNPLFTEELLDTLRESGHLYREADNTWLLSEALFNTLQQNNCLVKDGLRGKWVLAPNAPLSSIDLGIPDSVYGLILSRLDYLADAPKLTLKVASVIGRTFEFDLLAHAHPNQPDQAVLLEHIRALETLDLIRVDPTPARLAYAFRHHLIQETAYNTLPATQQHEFHLAVGKALEHLHPEETVERLAYHFQHSNARDKTLLYLDKAARKTQGEYANEIALNYYNQALALEERWQWRRGQIEVLHILGQREEQACSLQALADNSQAPAFEVAYLQGQYYEATGNYTEATTAVEQALTISRDLGNLEGEVQCLGQLGLIDYRQGNYQQAKGWYNQALARLQPEETYAEAVMQAFVRVFNGLGIVHNQLGEFEPAHTHYSQALTLSRLSNDRRGEANTLNSLGATAFYRRRFSQAQSYHKQALDIQRAIGDRVGEGTSLYNLGQITCDTGEYSEAQEYLMGALQILQATGNRWQEINVWNDLGILYQELGDLSKAQACLEKGLQITTEIGAQEIMASYLLSNLGLVMRDQGNLPKAKELLDEGLKMMQAIDNKRQIVYFLSYLSTVSLQANRFEQAIEQALEALALWGKFGLHFRTADELATLAAAHLGIENLEEAQTYAKQTLAILEECDGEGPEFPQRDYYIGYQVLSATGSRKQSFRALRSAHAIVDRRAEKITDPTLRQSFLKQVAVNRTILEEYKKHEEEMESLLS